MWTGLKQHWNRTKSFIHQGYRHATKFMGDLDRVAGVTKKLFSLATPALQDLGVDDRMIRSGVKAIGGCENLRSQVQDVDKVVRGHVKRFADADLF